MQHFIEFKKAEMWNNEYTQEQQYKQLMAHQIYIVENKP